MRVLIIGLGSIAKKHIATLNSLFSDVDYWALRSKENSKTESGVHNIYSLSELNEPIDFCIISNPTHLHFDAINQALDLKTTLFIEKPSLMNLDRVETLLGKINTNNIRTYVAFNLRFHPVLNYLKDRINPDDVLEANIYCGSYLPEWRPKTDYRKVYSAIEEMGGGVHLDLIHEIDYATWLFDFPEESISIKRKISNLEIDSIDYANYQLIYPDKTVSISLNYYRRTPKRSIELVTESGVINADLINQKVWNEKEEVIFSSDSTILDTYTSQMEYFTHLLSSGGPYNSTLENSLKNLKICLQ